jgi:hypothetical protein
MPYPQFDRRKVIMKPLAHRQNKKNIERDYVPVDHKPEDLSSNAQKTISEAITRIKAARKQEKPVMLSFGAHTIKNGLAPVLINLIEKGWVTHLATNGAGIIHDWEFAFQGETSEDVEGGVDNGEFGNWHETGHYINLAINIGAYEGKGYGESVGAFIENEYLNIPSREKLEKEVVESLKTDPAQSAVAADILSLIEEFAIPSGKLKMTHSWKKYSIQAAAYRLGIPFTGHPMIGHDIIYNNPMNHGASIGRAALRDFLSFADSVSRIDGGVYLSVGSAVMSPMIFEKSLSLSQNIAIQNNVHIDRHFMYIVDLAESHWDWTIGEPPEDNPDYYLRYNKTFSRMGGTMRYIQADNRDFLLSLYQRLNDTDN